MRNVKNGSLARARRKERTSGVFGRATRVTLVDELDFAGARFRAAFLVVFFAVANEIIPIY